MPSVASGHARSLGRVVGSGHCVAFVREVTGLPPTTYWRRGDPARGGNHAPGTAIATFGPDGRYPNTMSGDSHAAILLAELDNGLLVVDQWLGQRVHERTLRFRAGKGDAVNDGDRFYVIEIVEPDD
jgi:hypothetical protein